MPPMIKLRTTRSPKRQQLLETFTRAKQEVLKTMRGEIAKELTKQFDDIVDNWKDKPFFKVTAQADKDSLRIQVFPGGSVKAVNHWGWTTEGTKPHIIRPKKANALVFRKDYSPKTTAKPLTWGGSGISSGDLVRTQIVKHPGTEARNFEQQIVDKNKKFIAKEIEAAFKRGTK